MILYFSQKKYKYKIKTNSLEKFTSTINQQIINNLYNTHPKISQTLENLSKINRKTKQFQISASALDQSRPATDDAHAEWGEDNRESYILSRATVFFNLSET